MCGYGPGGSPLSSSPSKVISSFLMSVDHADNARQRRHGERKNPKDDGEGLWALRMVRYSARYSFGKPGP